MAVEVDMFNEVCHRVIEELKKLDKMQDVFVIQPTVYGKSLNFFKLR